MLHLFLLFLLLPFSTSFLSAFSEPATKVLGSFLWLFISLPFSTKAHGSSPWLFLSWVLGSFPWLFSSKVLGSFHWQVFREGGVQERGEERVQERRRGMGTEGSNGGGGRRGCKRGLQGEVPKGRGLPRRRGERGSGERGGGVGGRVRPPSVLLHTFHVPVTVPVPGFVRGAGGAEGEEQ